MVERIKKVFLLPMNKMRVKFSAAIRIYETLERKCDSMKALLYDTQNCCTTRAVFPSLKLFRPNYRVAQEINISALVRGEMRKFCIVALYAQTKAFQT